MMSSKRPPSGDSSECYPHQDEEGDCWDDDCSQETAVISITPPYGYKVKHRPGRTPVYQSKVILQKYNRPTENKRAREVIRRYEERRHVARQMLKPSPVPSTPSPRSIIRSRVADEFDYPSDFTDEDENDEQCIKTNEVLMASLNEDVSFMKKEKRIRRKTPLFGDRGEQSGDSQATGKIKSFHVGSQERPFAETDGRRFNLPHDRPLDPWRLPPIDNLIKTGPVNLVLNPQTNVEAVNDASGTPAMSSSEQALMKSLRVKARKLKKLERRHKKRKYSESKLNSS